jgi:pyrimidine-specific ribonucleoside hydrolase
MPSIIIDTDVGYDDLLAILYLMNCPDITITAFTVVNGISNPTDGSNALLKLQEKLGTTPAIPVYLGTGQQAFSLPPEYQGQANELGWGLPTRLKPETQAAADFLTAQFAAADTMVLALGPLTNLAPGLPSSSTAQIITVYAMGGAFKVAGDLPSRSPYPSDVEANFYVDPNAAGIVMTNAPKVYLVPLDACNLVPITPAYIKTFQDLPSDQQKPTWQYASDIFDKTLAFAQAGVYYAWDPLAAMALEWDPKLLSDWEQSGVAVEQVATGNLSPGKTTTTTAGSNVAVAYVADGTTFNDDFIASFSK